MEAEAVEVEAKADVFWRNRIIEVVDLVEVVEVGQM